jgi:hypothetical protein
VQTVEAPGLEGLALQHFYRTTAFLAMVRQDLERKLFFRNRDLFKQALDLVFIDTTSRDCWRDEETELCRRGAAPAHRQPFGTAAGTRLAKQWRVVAKLCSQDLTF